MNIEQRLATVENAVKMAGLTGKKILTFDEASSFTGLSKSYLYKLTSSRKIPHFKPSGKLCFFERVELENWLKSNRVSTTEELDGKAQKFCTKK